MSSIAVDAMGGDFAPGAVVEGVDLALRSVSGIRKLLLVGDERVVQRELGRIRRNGDPRIEVVHAPEVVQMDEPAITALRGKRQASITVAVNLVREGRADAVVSAGHTGAAVAATVVRLRTLPGVERPGIATVFPSPSGPFVLLDAGANVDAKPEHLVDYAIMGDVYARHILRFEAPRVGLLSVGTEDAKGNDLTKQAFKQLAALPGITFAGNVEGSDLFAGSVDVVVCDGFVGNVVLKCSEGLAKAFGKFLKVLLQKNPVRKAGALLSKNAFREFKILCDAEQYGGAPLLGVNGVCIIGHGSSSPMAICNALRVAAESVDHRLNDRIVRRLGELGPKRGLQMETSRE
ncbi:MAG: phosphate acyltransferase PlsX [Kiritimatiellaeota bacterium]|nr:phosphate acyltransferase PlsX [Kiritimatiellota bacterium]